MTHQGSGFFDPPYLVVNNPGYDLHPGSHLILPCVTISAPSPGPLILRSLALTSFPEGLVLIIPIA